MPEPAHVVRVTNLIRWEDAGLPGHGIGNGTPVSQDVIVYMNQSFVYWSDGSMTVYPGSVEEFCNETGFRR